MTAPAAQLPAGLDTTIRDLFGPDAQGVQGGVSKANELAAPNPPEDEDQTEPIAQYASLMAALYGSDFPLIAAMQEVCADDPQYETKGILPPLEAMLKRTDHGQWASWARGRWALHRAAVEMHLYLVARNRLFRASQQWVSSSGREPWRTPARPTESARVVHNLIAPALDQRQQVIADQRPGFQVEPTSMSPDEKRKADGRQQALEFQYDEQKMKLMTAEAAYWAGTDGVSFWHTFWDRDAGPLDHRMGSNGVAKPLGDLRTKVLRVEQVRVSANATATEAPYYAIVREVLSATEAAYLYGLSGVQDRATTGDIAGQTGSNDSSGSSSDGIMPSWVLTQTIVGEGNRLNNIPTVERFTVYVDKHPDILPEGLQLVVVGNAVIWGPGELLFGTLPVTPVRDGSTDPSYFPRPIMEQWIAPQMRINAALSLWVNSVRVNAGGRILAKPDAISRETFVGSGLSLLEVESPGPISDAVQPLNGFLVGQDVKDLIAFDVKAIEDMSGYNDVSRGQVSGETATAVATANEQLQRVFAPPVEAMASAFQQWAPIQLAGMAWGYDLERDVGSVGTDRPDLARALSSKDFEGPSTVRVDAEKMMPMPKFVRQAQLDDLLARQLITPQQFMRNLKFASVRNIESPDEDQTARAKRVADAIRMGQPLPPLPPLPGQPPAIGPDGQPVNPNVAASLPLALRWQTNEAIEQDVLEREILLQDDLDPAIIQAGAQRWAGAAAQAAAKQAPPPMMNGGPPPAGLHAGSQTEPPPGGSPVSGGPVPPTPGGPTSLPAPTPTEPTPPSQSDLPPMVA